MASELVVVNHFVFASDAEVARATLLAAGIDAVLVSDSSKPTEPVRLLVHADDAAAAREVLDAQLEVVEEPVQMLENEEHCHRCFSTEVYRTERGRIFARVILLMFAVGILMQFMEAILHRFGQELHGQVMNGVFGLILMLPFATAIYIAVAPRKRCRNCGLEWRGTQHPS